MYFQLSYITMKEHYIKWDRQIRICEFFEQYPWVSYVEMWQ